MRIGLVYWRFLDWNGQERFIGGIETYISSLVSTFANTHDIRIFQCADIDFRVKLENVEIVGVKTPSVEIGSRKNLDIVCKACLDNFAPHKIIFGTEEWAKKIKGVETIGIQHGIYWDKPISYLTKKSFILHWPFEGLKRYALRRKALSNLETVDKLVCVDYNFINWLRTFRTVEAERMVVIPNAITVNSRVNRIFGNETIKVVFARRFEDFRGTLLMMEVVELLQDFAGKFEFTFAGTGSLEGTVRYFAKTHDNVYVTRYESKDAQEFFTNYDVAVIPSLGSEGTSYSLLEAMSVGCIALATNVGGMTNIVLDDFNGYLLDPSAKAFAEKLRTLHNRKRDFNRISQNAIDSVGQSFNVHAWGKRWIDFVENE